MATFDAVCAAKEYLTAAMRAGYEVGGGHSPVNHFHAFESMLYPERIAQ
jgi:hydroxymethylpyrimidine/phosphomethylpyrimidine kinase